MEHKNKRTLEIKFEPKYHQTRRTFSENWRVISTERHNWPQATYILN